MLPNTSNGGTLNTGYFRDLKTAHSISELKITPSRELVDAMMELVGERAELYRGVNIRIDVSSELMEHGLFGWTSEDGKEVHFYANAFLDAENLSVTIAHESKHLQQVLERGIATNSAELGKREREAMAYEDEWWNENGERIVKAFEDSDWI